MGSETRWVVRNGSYDSSYGVQSVDTEPMEGFKEDEIRALFKIPSNYEIPMFVCLGYKSKEQLPNLKRKTFEELVHLNKMH